jgi:putative DNA primase/helicase
MEKKAEPKKKATASSSSSTLADDLVIERARAAKNGAKFARLWSGEAGEDPSVADAALVGILSFWTQDPAQLDRLFRRSGLMREKWDERRGESTYGERTIAAVLLKGGEHYSEPRQGTQKAAGGADWPELDPLPEVGAAVPAAFPFDGLGPTMGAAAREIADAVQAPDAIAAGSVLAAASLAAQPHHNVVLPHGKRAPLSLFVATSATSGDRKSETDNIAGAAIYARRDADHKRYARAKLKHDAEMAERKRGDPAPPEPVQQSVIVSKGTIEGVLRLLSNQPHVGVFSNEGAEVFGGHSMREDRRSSGVAFYCKAWDGATLDNVTASEGVRVLLGRRVCMHAMLQPVVLRPLLADPVADGQGLLARCLIAEPASLAGSRLFPENMVPATDRPEVKLFQQRIRTLVERALPQEDDAALHQLTPAPLQLSAAARSLWIEFYNEVERQQAPGQALEGVRPWASKAAEQAGRVAGVIACVEGHSEVTVEDMKAAVQVVDFYLGEHVRLMGASVEDRHLRQLTMLLTWMKEQGRPVKHKADLLQRSPYAIRSLKAEGIKALLDELQQRGYIRRSGDSWEVRPDA